MASRVWGKSEDGRVEYINYSDKYLDGAINVMRSFFAYEAFCVGSAIDKSPEALKDMEKFATEMIKRSYSIIARDVTNDRVVGIAVCAIHVDNPNGDCIFEKLRNDFKTDNARCAIGALIEIESKFNFYQHFEVDSLIELLFLAVLPEYCGRRIAHTLSIFSIERATEWKNGSNLETLRPEHRNKVPKILTATMTSKYSQKIGRKLGFEDFVTVSHKDFKFEGKSFAERMGEPQSVSILVAREL